MFLYSASFIIYTSLNAHLDTVKAVLWNMKRIIAEAADDNTDRHRNIWQPLGDARFALTAKFLPSCKAQTVCLKVLKCSRSHWAAGICCGPCRGRLQLSPKLQLVERACWSYQSPTPASVLSTAAPALANSKYAIGILLHCSASVNTEYTLSQTSYFWYNSCVC